MTTSTTTSEAIVTGERADLLEALGKQRFFLKMTAQGLTDEQAGVRSTVSELCLGGLIKHVTQTEEAWANFIVEGPSSMAQKDFSEWTPEDFAERENSFRMLPGETLEEVIAAYDRVAARTDELVASVDLDSSHPLPSAPWFEEGKRWSARRVLVHIVAETAQHSGHADIIREALDGQKSMG
jgi:uncharacterized damage-inducible protein DinB